MTCEQINDDDDDDDEVAVRNSLHFACSQLLSLVR